MSIAHSAGRFVGQAAAYAYEGTRLASTQFAAGAAEGYEERAALLRAARLAALRGEPVVTPPAKTRVIKVKA
jgi:hypothetical protein